LESESAEASMFPPRAFRVLACLHAKGDCQCQPELWSNRRVLNGLTHQSQHERPDVLRNLIVILAGPATSGMCSITSIHHKKRKMQYVNSMVMYFEATTGAILWLPLKSTL
jgi:hypothetical protein